MALSDDFSRGLIQKSTYIRLAIASPRHSLGDSYDVPVPLAGVTLSEVFAEASLMVRDELLDIAIAPFTVTWAQPELLPSFSPTAVQGMQVSGRGFLYFALGADNQGKTKIQPVDPTRLYTFYKMSRSDFLAELGRLLETKTAMVDVSNLTVRWLNKTAPAAREFQSIADVVIQLRKEMTEAIAKIPTPLPTDLSAVMTELDNLAGEINERQLRGDYVLTSSLNSAIAKLNEADSSLQKSKQSAFVINAGDYGAVGDLVYRQTAHNTVAIVSGTDTTASIQAALNAARDMVSQDVNLPYEGAVRVVVPPGKYIIAGDKGLEVPSNVILDSAHAVFFNFLNNDWEPVIKGRRHAHATIIQVHGNKKSGIEWGDRNAGGVRCDSFIEGIRVQHCGVEYESTLPPNRQKCGLRLFGLWFSIDRIEVKEANIGLDIYQASDLLCPALFLMGCSTACRMESAEQIILPCVALDTNFNTGFQIDNSGNVFVNVTAFVNSDGYGSPMDTLLRIGQYSGTPCKDIYITAAAMSIGGRMLSIQNCMDSAFTLYASNARLFSQTSGNGQATSHWNAISWTSVSGEVNGGGLKAHDIGVNYQPYGNEGTPTALIKYGSGLSGFLDIGIHFSGNLTVSEGNRYGQLRINGQQQDLLDRILVIESRPPAMPFSLSINCGRGWGNPVFENGNHWIRDSYFAGGTAGANGVTNTVSDIPWLYEEERYGTSVYTIPVADGKYTVKLHFAENFHTAAGQRVFNVEVQGVVVLTAFDIFTAAGGGRRALIRSFPGIASVNKQITVRIYDPGTIMGIQLVRE